VPGRAWSSAPPDLLLQRTLDLTFGPRAKLQGEQLLRSRSHALANIIARNDQVFAILGAPTDDDMNVRMLRVPMIDRNPVERRAKVAFSISHQVAGKSFDVGKFGGIFRRHNEPEMMPVIVTALCESLMIDVVALSTEHPGWRAFLRHAVAAQIGEMSGKRRALHSVTDDAGFDDDIARPASYSAHCDEARGAAPAKGSTRTGRQ
jgi:hypothetical protein